MRKLPTIVLNKKLIIGSGLFIKNGAHNITFLILHLKVNCVKYNATTEPIENAIISTSSYCVSNIFNASK